MAKLGGPRNAFGQPGIAPRWTHGDKDGVGTAYAASSRVWFTLWNGILTEVYYPTADRPQIRDLQLLVTDGKSIFGLHSMQGVLTCMDVETGKVKWRGEREGPGQLLLADGLLLVVNGDLGEVALFETDPATCNELARQPLLNDKTWNTPALGGRSIVCAQSSEDRMHEATAAVVAEFR